MPGLAALRPPASAQGHAWKWWIAVVLFLATVLTYLDRQTVSLCSPQIREEFHLSNEQYGQLLATFRWAYAPTHVLAGWLADRVSIRFIYALAVGLWSMAGAGAGFAFGFRQLRLTRGVLGVGEAFNWPCATRIVANLFTPADRGLGSGIFNSGSAVGSLLAPLLITPIAVQFGWRWAFLSIGGLGLFWIVLWILVTRRGHAAHEAVTQQRPQVAPPAEAAPGCGAVSDHAALMTAGLACTNVAPGDLRSSPSAGSETRAEPQGSETRDERDVAPPADAGNSPSRSTALRQWMHEVLLHPAFWLLVVIGCSANPCWYFLNEWIPNYLHQQRGMRLLTAGLLTFPIFFGADLGNLLSGGLIKHLVGRGWSLRRARATTLLGACLLILPVALITQVESIALSIAILSLAALGLTSLLANYTACQQDLSFANVGIVAGILGMLCNVCSAVVNPWIGRYVDRTGNYTLIFVLLGILPLVTYGGIVAFDAIIWGRRCGDRYGG
jgi:ACS family hexuronate transporter-like MFS transporter